MARRSVTRWLAPLAIAAVAAAAYGIVASSRSAGDGSPAIAPPVATDTKADEPTKPPKRTYRVRSGDTLSAISVETGVSVGTLQELNPDLDAQALQPGQRLKLRP